MTPWVVAYLGAMALFSKKLFRAIGKNRKTWFALFVSALVVSENLAPSLRNPKYAIPLPLGPVE